MANLVHLHKYIHIYLIIIIIIIFINWTFESEFMSKMYT